MATMESRTKELEAMIARYQVDVTELNRRLSAQNRPGLQLQSAIETACIILSAHIASQGTGRRSIQRNYPHVGRRKWEYGTALLKMAGIVSGSDGVGLLFNTNLSISRAWEKLRATGTELSSVAQLTHFLPRGRQGQRTGQNRAK